MLKKLGVAAGGMFAYMQMNIKPTSETESGLNIVPEETLPPFTEVSSVEDTVDLVGSIIEWCVKYAKDVLIPAGIKLLIALVIFFIGKFVVKKVVNILQKSLIKGNVEEGTVHFLSSLANGAGIIVVIAICANYLNFGTGAIIAVLGSGGLALGLSLQGSLENFAGGILLLLTKPFRVGDYIIALGNEGCVTKMDIIYTTLVTPDNRKIVLPNGNLSGANIVNVTDQEKRRVDISVGVDYASDIREVKKVLEEIAVNNEMVLVEDGINIFVDNFDSSAITMGLRVWTKSENYWNVKWDIQEQIKYEFDAKGISIPFDRVDVNMMQ